MWQMLILVPQCSRRKRSLSPNEKRNVRRKEMGCSKMDCMDCDTGTKHKAESGKGDVNNVRGLSPSGESCISEVKPSACGIIVFDDCNCIRCGSDAHCVSECVADYGAWSYTDVLCGVD
eukprot:EG_transcript_51106